MNYTINTSITPFNGITTIRTKANILSFRLKNEEGKLFNFGNHVFILTKNQLTINGVQITNQGAKLSLRNDAVLVNNIWLKAKQIHAKAKGKQVEILNDTDYELSISNPRYPTNFLFDNNAIFCIETSVTLNK